MNMNFSPTAAPLEALEGAEVGRQPEPVSVAGVVLLSALAVTLTIMGVLLLGALMAGAYWLISRIPVPTFVWHALAYLRAAL